MKEVFDLSLEGMEKALACSMAHLGKGNKARVNYASNGSFHDCQYYPVVMSGDGVRSPMSKAELERALSSQMLESYQKNMAAMHREFGRA